MAGDMERQASHDELRLFRREACDLKEIILDMGLEQPELSTREPTRIFIDEHV